MSNNKERIARELLIELRKQLLGEQGWPDTDTETQLLSRTLDLVEWAQIKTATRATTEGSTEREHAESSPEPLAPNAVADPGKGDQEPAAQSATSDSGEQEQEQEQSMPSAAENPSEDVSELPSSGVSASNQDEALRRAVPAIDPHRKPGAIPVNTLPSAEPAPQRLIVTIGANANAGEPYRTTIEARTDSGRRARILSCDIPALAGVQYADGELFGSTPEAGEYRIVVTGACQAGECPLTGSTELIINHDPKSLWKNKPSDRYAPGWKPDESASMVSGIDRRHLIGASIRGRSHAHNGGFRDDHFVLRVSVDGRWNILAVGDGAGSAGLSRIGSSIATEVAAEQTELKLASLAEVAIRELLKSGAASTTRTLKVMFYEAFGGAALEALKAIEDHATTNGVEVRDYATTLLLAVHTRLPIGDLVGTFWVGDGAIALCDRERGAHLLGQPDSGEFSGQTRFLDRSALSSGEEIMSRIHCRITPALDALLLMSDGVSDPLFESDVELHSAPQWVALWDELKPLVQADKATEQLLSWLQFWSKGHHDDRTIAVLY